MHVPVFHGLSPMDVIRPPRGRSMFPFEARDARYFYRARNAIYYLFLALTERRGRLTVLVPDYNSGNEVLAIRAAGASIVYCPVGRDMRMNPDEVERLCDIHRPDILYVIHYAGWPQPISTLVDLSRRREMLIVEDCALALLSETVGRPLGSFGDWSIFCLYKTLPLPNGALLVQNTDREEPLPDVHLRSAGAPSTLGRAVRTVRAASANAARWSRPRTVSDEAGSWQGRERSQCSSRQRWRHRVRPDAGRSRDVQDLRTAARSRRSLRHPATAHGQLSRVVRASRRQGQPAAPGSRTRRVPALFSDSGSQ